MSRKQINGMFDGINMYDYIIQYDIHKAYFLRDCLHEEISYELNESNESNIVIYKKLENGISSEISLDELIFYIHTEVAESIKVYSNHNQPGFAPPENVFFHLFRDINSIRKAVENMKIILKYDSESYDEEQESSDEEEMGKNEDNKTLAF
tara:strand:- start:320 stop:772 length:453 start_codon:yes stop_codon:yes gene_type:complete